MSLAYQPSPLGKPSGARFAPSAAGVRKVSVVGGRIVGMGGELALLGDAEVLDELRTVERESRVVWARMLDTIAEIGARDLAGPAGFGSTARLLADMLHLSRGEAGRRVASAAVLGPRRAVTGDVLEPTLPVLAAAVADGSVNPEQVRVITKVLDAVPATVSPDERALVEKTLTDHARDFDPTALARVGARLLDHLDPDGPEPAHPDQPYAAGELRIRDRRGDGIHLEGWLDAEHGAAVRGLLDRLAKPTGKTDERTEAQRTADALVEACALAGTVAPDTAGEPPHVSVHIDFEDLRSATGAGMLDHGQYLPASEVRRLACDAKIIPIVLGGRSEPLDVGRAQRTIPLSIRRALVARDGGCAFPGCGRPPARTSGHHIRHWADGGDTSVDNCVLLCESHHVHIHRTGWQITTHDGQVQFRSPAILGPDRRPFRNPLRL